MQWTTVPIRAPDQPFLTLGEVARVVGRNRKTVQRWVREGKFPEPRSVAGGGLRWTAMAVAVWLAWQDYCPRTEAAPQAEVGAADRDDDDDDDDKGEEAPLAARPEPKRGGKS